MLSFGLVFQQSLLLISLFFACGVAEMATVGLLIKIDRSSRDDNCINFR